jgi:hypothetical protein
MFLPTEITTFSGKAIRKFTGKQALLICHVKKFKGPTISEVHVHYGVVLTHLFYENYTQETAPQFGSDSIKGLNKECSKSIFHKSCHQSTDTGYLLCVYITIKRDNSMSGGFI